MKSRSHEIGTLSCRIAIVEVPVKFQSDQTILNTNLAASRLYEILRKDVFSDIETGPSILGRATSEKANIGQAIKAVSPEGTFCDTVQVPSGVGDMQLI